MSEPIYIAFDTEVSVSDEDVKQAYELGYDKGYGVFSLRDEWPEIVPRTGPLAVACKAGWADGTWDIQHNLAHGTSVEIPTLKDCES